MRLPVAVWVSFWVAAWVGVAVLANLTFNGGVNALHVLVNVFLAINLIVCYWEMCLLWRIDAIEERYQRRQSGERPSDDPRTRGSFFLSSVAFGELGSRDLWSRVWSEYSLYDPSYSDRKSFGFAIDVGNGFSTLLPSLIVFVGMSFPVLPAIAVGLVGLLVFYQKFYGTLLYFFTYVFNRRYQGKPLANVMAFVGGINGIWLVGPGIGIYVCLRLILDGGFDVIWG